MTPAGWMAVAALITAIGGIALSIRAQRRQAEEQNAATKAAQSQNRINETQQALDATVSRAERAESGEAQNRKRAEAAERRVDDLESRIDEQRHTFRAQLSAQEMACHEHQAALVEMNHNLRELVVAEIADEAGVDPATLPQHPHGL